MTESTHHHVVGSPRADALQFQQPGTSLDMVDTSIEDEQTVRSCRSNPSNGITTCRRHRKECIRSIGELLNGRKSMRQRSSASQIRVDWRSKCCHQSARHGARPSKRDLLAHNCPDGRLERIGTRRGASPGHGLDQLPERWFDS